MEPATTEETIPNQETPQPQETKKDNHGITILSMAIFVLLSLAAVVFLYYQNQQLKTMLASYKFTPSPIPTVTLNPSANWKTYTNDFYKYSFKYPNDASLETTKMGDGLVNAESDTKDFQIRTNMPNNEFIDVSALDYFATLIRTNDWEKIDVEINGQKIEAYKNKKVEVDINKLLYRFKDLENEVQVDFILNYPNEKSELLETFTQILSTFKFVESPSPTKSPIACTLEARVCPDGSAVGRTAPNCEFTPCPTP